MSDETPEYERMLVIGFDGLDFKKIQKYECENLQLETFGKLDLEGLNLATPVLWASMVTGKKPDEHGIEDMLEFRGEKVRKADRTVSKLLGKFGMAGLHLRKCLWYYIFDSSISVPDKSFMNTESIFEKVADSKALDVPGYSEYPYIAGNMNVAKLTRDHPPVSKERVKRDIDAEHLYRKKQLFENINEHKLVMQHLHYSDWHQHMYLSEEKDCELYAEMDELAAEIKQKADENTLLVFTSDHGLEDGGHRDQAFYSTNAPIEEPVKITNLLFKCLEYLDYQEAEQSIEELDV